SAADPNPSPPGRRHRRQVFPARRRRVDSTLSEAKVNPFSRRRSILGPGDGQTDPMAMDSLFDRALATARQLGASDIHLKPGLEPVLRIDGELRTLRNPDVPQMSRDFLHNLAMSLLNDRRRDILERLGDVTVALVTSNGTRQRVHISQHRAGMMISMHLV